MSEETVSASSAPEITPATTVDIAWPPSAAEGGPEPTVAAETPDAEPQEVKTVPLAALHEERSRRKEEARRAQEATANFQALQRQQVEMMQQMQRMGQPQYQPPDPNQDPVGFGLHQNAQTQHQIQSLQDQIQRRDQADVAQRNANHFTQAVLTNEQAFVSQSPDYYEAVNWAKDRKLAEYTSAGMLEHEAQNRLNSEILDLTSSALSRGDNPAEIAYRMAKTMGYTPKQIAASQKLEMQRDGNRAAMPSGGSGQGTRLSLDSLMKMGSSDFLKATSGDNWKKLAGKLG